MTGKPKALPSLEESNEPTVVSDSHDVTDAQQQKRALELEIQTLLNQYQETHGMKILSINLKRFFNQPRIEGVSLVILL